MGVTDISPDRLIFFRQVTCSSGENDSFYSRKEGLSPLSSVMR